MTPTRTAEEMSERVPPVGIPLPGDPKKTLVSEACRHLPPAAVHGNPAARRTTGHS
ncbi:hypothetical protein [Streptomyces palmae]|uniref:hypothetical protein n=1 Tax=Streptomyces palmae TaxID=1701085 RepID=UPI001432D646|nr:hypothetical protein [Streptomyces palmae]